MPVPLYTFNIYKCVLWLKKKRCSSWCMHPSCKNTTWITSLLSCNIKKKKKKAPNLPLLFSYYSLVLSFPQGESESWHFMTINSIVSVLTGRRVLAHSEVYSDRVLLGSWKTQLIGWFNWDWKNITIKKMFLFYSFRIIWVFTPTGTSLLRLCFGSNDKTLGQDFRLHILWGPSQFLFARGLNQNLLLDNEDSFIEGTVYCKVKTSYEKKSA